MGGMDSFCVDMFAASGWRLTFFGGQWASQLSGASSYKDVAFLIHGQMGIPDKRKEKCLNA
jgi:hypothetical protein